MAAPVRPQAHIPIDRTRHVNKILGVVALLAITSIFFGIFGKSGWGQTGLKSALYGGTSVGILTMLAALYKRFAIDNKPYVAVRNKDGTWEWMAISTERPIDHAISMAFELFRPNEFLVYWDTEINAARFAYKEPNDIGGFNQVFDNDPDRGLPPIGYRQASPLAYHFLEDQDIHHEGLLSALEPDEWTHGRFVKYDHPSKPSFLKFLKLGRGFRRCANHTELPHEKYVEIGRLKERLANKPIPLEQDEAQVLARFLQQDKENFHFCNLNDENHDTVFLGNVNGGIPVTYKTLFDRQQQAGEE